MSRVWAIPFRFPEAGDRYDQTDEAAFRMEVRQALEQLPATLDTRYVLAEIVTDMIDHIAQLEQRIEQLENP